MSKPLLRDGDGLRQQAGVAVDLAPLAVHAGFCPAGDIVGEATPALAYNFYSTDRKRKYGKTKMKSK
jgi:hypothetical protein